MANANFTPDIGPYTTLKPFRFWCQKVLPLVYDDSLSYYELLGKVVDYLNKTMEDVDTVTTDMQGLLSAYEALQGWVNHYYDSADFAADIDAGLDRMAESGQLTTLLTAIVNPELPGLVDDLLPEVVLTLLPDEVSSQIGGTVATQLPGVVSNQIGGTVATQLPGVVSNQIGGTVANQLPAVVSNQIGPVVEDKIVDPVEDWLDTNVSGGIAVDRTLSILGAGADAGFTGARLETLDNVAGYEHIADTGFIITTASPYVFNTEFIDNDNASFSDSASHTYKMMVIPVNTGDKYCINAHKISIANITANHFAVTYAFCAKYEPIPGTDVPRYLPTTYSADDAENVIATVPEIVIPTGQGYDETTGYLVVITANIEDPIYKVIDEGLRKEISDLKSAINDEPTDVIIEKNISAGYINSNGTIDPTIGGYSLITIQNDSFESFTVTNLNAEYSFYCLYDSNDDPLMNRTRYSVNTTIDVPTNVGFIRICSATAAINSCIVTASKYTPLHSVFADTESLKNLVNSETYIYPTQSQIINDAYINQSGYIITGATGYLATDFLRIPFNESQSFQIHGVVHGYASCAIYNANFEPLLVITENNVSQYGGALSDRFNTLTIPYIDGMQYARLSARTSVYSELTDLWTKGNTLAGAFKRISNVETDLQTVEGNISTAIASSKVLVIGDSISTDAYGSYPKWVTDLINSGFLPSDTVNSSQHATGFVARYNNEANDFITRLKAIQNPSQYDLVVVFGGINDYIQNIPMGSESGTDYTTSFKPAVNEFFSYLIQNFTQARLCVLLPLRTYATWINSKGEYQQAYGDYIKQVAKSYCLPVLNLTEDSGFCPYVQPFRDKWTLVPAGYESADGIHPNQEYERRFLAPMIRHFLQGLM